MHMRSQSRMHARITARARAHTHTELTHALTRALTRARTRTHARTSNVLVGKFYASFFPAWYANDLLKNQTKPLLRFEFCFSLSFGLFVMEYFCRDLL